MVSGERFCHASSMIFARNFFRVTTRRSGISPRMLRFRKPGFFRKWRQGLQLPVDGKQPFGDLTFDSQVIEEKRRQFYHVQVGTDQYLQRLVGDAKVVRAA